MKRLFFCVFVFLLFFTTALHSEKVAEFPELMQPVRMSIDRNEMFVVDGRSKISVYSISAQQFLRDISRRGEGPGEYKYLPLLKILQDSIFLGAYNKVMVYSRDGKLIEEKRLFPAARALPVGDNLVAFGTDVDGKNTYRTIFLLNADLKTKKVLHRQLRIPRRGGINPIRDYLGFDTHEGKIFIVDSREGFLIEVFDNQGEELYRIKKDVDKIRITNDFKLNYLEQLTSRPGGQGAEWKAAVERFGVEYDKYFPEIREFLLADGKIYVQTYKTKAEKTEFIVLDLAGKILQTEFLPLYEMGSLVDKRVYTFYRDSYYYLAYDENGATWGLHRIKMN